VESDPGLGSTFDIFLPIIDTADAAAAGIPQKEVTLKKNRETILLVDDEEPIREVNQDMLLALGYQVIVASDGQEALDMYQIHGERIDIILLDMIMPRMSGGKVYDRLKKMNPDVKVLLSSGYSIESQASEIIDKGCNGFIQKPFDIKALNHALRKILDENGHIS
jgi:CheY-like chemotaxis protein